MRSVIILLAIALAVSCKPSVSTSTQTNELTKPSPASSVIQQTSKIFPLPKVQSIVQVDVWRESGVKDAHSFDLPPYKKVNLNHIGFNQKPTVGEKVTVVPLEVDIAPIELKILKAIEREDPCDKSLPHYWEIELEPITQREFFEVSAIPKRREDIPFDVCLIYPAVEFARQIKKEQLTKDMIPEGATIKTVTAAIDLTNDQKPDILIAFYCCGESTKLPEECDLTCGKIFKKVNGAWKLFDDLAPC